jgi:hypothetical protein
MSSYYQENNNIILEKNVSNLNFKDKNIIYYTQYISGEDTQIDSDGPQSYWTITLVCIEKTTDDYIFHFNYSGALHGYCYPYFKIVSDFTTFSKKLSNLKNDFNTILEKPTNEIGYFLKMWEDEYCFAFNTTDSDLMNEMKILATKIPNINEIYEQRYTLENEEAAKKYNEYLQSEAYQQFLKDEEERKQTLALEYQKKEESRLKACIELFGEKEGREFHRIL